LPASVPAGMMMWMQMFSGVLVFKRTVAVNIQWAISEHSVNTQWTFSEHSVNNQRTFSRPCQHLSRRGWWCGCKRSRESCCWLGL
jgi:hypothetical protein